MHTPKVKQNTHTHARNHSHAHRDPDQYQQHLLSTPEPPRPQRLRPPSFRHSQNGSPTLSNPPPSCLENAIACLAAQLPPPPPAGTTTATNHSSSAPNNGGKVRLQSHSRALFPTSSYRQGSCFIKQQHQKNPPTTLPLPQQKQQQQQQLQAGGRVRRSISTDGGVPSDRVRVEYLWMLCVCSSVCVRVF